ncbi:hypothetical protein GCM10011613_00410 [Cellvibrio zantedeschiae]|uniref:Uncharacterized protein n=1 Tax=Cellvibrio zantedeschiae TaxID=1237077 RepID=A0ABQ3AP23_9GAMM|nr:hypothetical protein GCM10011613_00410 [Cellvibrio zantedeschiae]
MIGVPSLNSASAQHEKIAIFELEDGDEWMRFKKGRAGFDPDFSCETIVFL